MLSYNPKYKWVGVHPKKKTANHPDCWFAGQQPGTMDSRRRCLGVIIQMVGSLGREIIPQNAQDTLPENQQLAHENGWLEDYFAFETAYFQWLC